MIAMSIISYLSFVPSQRGRMRVREGRGRGVRSNFNNSMTVDAETVLKPPSESRLSESYRHDFILMKSKWEFFFTRYSSFLSEGICAQVSLLSDLNDNFWPRIDTDVQSAALRVIGQVRARVITRARLQAHFIRILRRISLDVDMRRPDRVGLSGGPRDRAVRRIPR